MYKTSIYYITSIFLLILLSTTSKAQSFDEYKKQISTDLSNMELHENFILNIGADSKKLQQQYDHWIKSNPQNWQLPLLLGNALKKIDVAKSDYYLLKAVNINSQLAETWLNLSLNAHFSGKEKQAIQYMENALKAAPTNINYWVQLGSYYKETNPKKQVEIYLKAATLEQGTSSSGFALLLATQAELNESKRLALYNKLMHEYDYEILKPYDYTMGYYYDELFKIDPKLAQDMVNEILNNKKKVKPQSQWEERADVAGKMASAKQAYQAGKYDVAKRFLENTRLATSLQASKDLLVFKADIENQLGNFEAAYRMLFDTYVKTPDILYKNKIEEIAKKLGKSTSEVNAEIWQVLDLKAKPATVFALKKYEDNKSISLSELKGKVVFITYWYPGCGPCRAEFPHFENVLRKFKKTDVVYLGFNITARQNDMVMPFMKANNYSFIPLDDTKPRDKGNLDNNLSAPVNFLLDKDGRLVFSKFRTDQYSEGELEAMIQLLVDKK